VDLLALIAAEPTLIPLWLVLAFAAGMYPVGMLFSCTPCCSPCSACEEGTLPETLTVAISGIPATTLGPPLVPLSFSSCYGSGAAGHATAPVQSAPASDIEDDRGPITAATVTHGGSGYARLGRVEPTLTATGSGDGATLAVTVEASEDDCGIDFWKVSKVTASGGTGYTDGEQLTITVAEGDTAEQDATVTLKTTRSAPTLAVAVNSYGGSGAAFTVATNPNPGTPATWAAASVTVTEGGSGYADGEGVTVTGDTDRDLTVGAANGYIRTGRLAPTVEVSVASSVGSGAVLAATLTTGTGSSSGRPVWIVDAITITDGGADYEVGDGVYVSVTDGTQEWSSSFEATVDAVDASGAIESVTVTSGGEYYKDSGEIDEVVLEQYGTYFGGSYYHDDGVASVATVASGGVYYREDASIPPYVAEVAASASNIAPSNGSGAVLSGVVDDDPESETFGQITGVNVDDGGDGYLAHEVFESCLNRFNGRSIVVKRKYNYWSIYPFFPIAVSPDACIYGYTCANIDSCSLEAEAVLVQYRGPDEPMLVGLYLHQRGQGNLPLGGGYLYPAAYGNFVASENVQDCSDIDLTANGLPSSATDGATAHVQGGGEYDEVDACRRISAEDMNALYAEVTWGDFSASSADAGSECGWSSSVSIGGQVIDTTGQWCDGWKDEHAAVGGRCFEYHALPSVTLRIGRTDTCGWEWNNQPGWFQDGSFVCGGIERRVGYGANWNNTYRTCSWCYPILRVVRDEETLLPTSLELGDAVFSTFGPTAGWSATYDPEGQYMGEAAVCQDPGKPTFTFSVLP